MHSSLVARPALVAIRQSSLRFRPNQFIVAAGRSPLVFICHLSFIACQPSLVTCNFSIIAHPTCLVTHRPSFINDSSLVTTRRHSPHLICHTHTSPKACPSTVGACRGHVSLILRRSSLTDKLNAFSPPVTRDSSLIAHQSSLIASCVSLLLNRCSSYGGRHVLFFSRE